MKNFFKMYLFQEVEKPEMKEYRESGEEVSGNTVWVLRDWG